METKNRLTVFIRRYRYLVKSNGCSPNYCAQLAAAADVNMHAQESDKVVVLVLWLRRRCMPLSTFTVLQ